MIPSRHGSIFTLPASTSCKGFLMDVLTHHNDISRTGTYPAETVLTPHTVAGGGFRKLYERNVSGDVYAQTLYVRAVPVGQHLRNLCYVATSTNFVYAFDADDLNTDPNTPAVWSRQLDPSRILTGSEICGETIGSVGITSTPVIDLRIRNDVRRNTFFVAESWWCRRRVQLSACLGYCDRCRQTAESPYFRISPRNGSEGGHQPGFQHSVPAESACLAAIKWCRVYRLRHIQL